MKTLFLGLVYICKLKKYVFLTEDGPCNTCYWDS